MSEKTRPDGFCRIGYQNPGCTIYFGAELAKLIHKTMPLSNTPGAPKYVVAVEPEKITITVAKL
ncbi:MAG: hypothetical protein DRI69_09800 [Bacteroidetes bacterium]|nr:MAG: hypothetical protein DRI69_09800 [Bacteroidota bacterium]